MHSRRIERCRPWLLLAALPLVVSACKTECVSDQAYFEAKVLPILQKNCQACHNPTGDALNTDYVLRPASQPDYIEANLEVFRRNASRIEKGKGPLLIVKPTLQIAHQGGLRFEIGSDSHKAFEEMLRRFDNPTASCPGEILLDDLKEVQALGTAETYRKATIALAGRIPTDDEVAALDADPGALDGFLDGLLEEPAFYDTLKRWTNDLLLTDRFIRTSNSNVPAAQTLENYCDDGRGGPGSSQDCDYPSAYFWNGLAAETTNAAAGYPGAGSSIGNWSLARSPVELVAHVVRENRPFTEILTADYMMMNGYSAKSYGVNIDVIPGGMNGVKFRTIADNPRFSSYVRTHTDEADPDDFREARIAKYPHAGILSDPIYNATYGTTNTNVNRKRARFVFKYFLATDVLRDVERPVDITNVGGNNPTRDDANCRSCHGIVDPVAGAFQDFGDDGRWKLGRVKTIFEKMREIGFRDEEMPKDQANTAIQWMAQRVASDPRFVTAAVRLAYTGLTGQTPLEVPTDNTNPLFDGQMKAFRIQGELFKAVGQSFVASGYNFKVALKALVNSQVFRGHNTKAALSSAREGELFDIGTAHMSTPETMALKIRAVTGLPWGGPTVQSAREVKADARSDALFSRDAYAMLYGGIDSFDVTQRLQAPNGLIASIAKRMSLEMGCSAMAQEFARPIQERNLLRFVQPTYVPEDANGFVIQGSIDKIKQNIQYLHWRVLGERIDIDDPEIDRTYQVFLETWRELRDGAAQLRAAQKDGGPDGIVGCNADVEYWSADRLFGNAPSAEQLAAMTASEKAKWDAGYRAINTDFNRNQSPSDAANRAAMRSWSAVLTYLLSDHAFIYE